MQSPLEAGPPPGSPEREAADAAAVERQRSWMASQHAQWEARQQDERARGRVIVCGGPVFDDFERVYAALDRLAAKRRITEIAHTSAPGAELAAGQWARTHRIPERRYGVLEVAEMVAAGAVGCVAFPGDLMTADLVQRVREAGIPVWEPYKRG